LQYGGAVSGTDEPLDHVGQRRLQGGEMWFWYLFAGITYVGVSLWQKFLLNWLVGPVWLIVVIWAGPAVYDRLRRREQ
jgi:hypothetical protein